VPDIARGRSGGDTGSVSTEYVLLAVFIAIAAAVTIGLLGMTALRFFTDARTEVPWNG
jgi:Flp pilus assembly pilin Flp